MKSFSLLLLLLPPPCLGLLQLRAPRNPLHPKKEQQNIPFNITRITILSMINLSPPTCLVFFFFACFLSVFVFARCRLSGRVVRLVTQRCEPISVACCCPSALRQSDARWVRSTRCFPAPLATLLAIFLDGKKRLPPSAYQLGKVK